MMNKQIDLKKAIVGIILISLVSSSLVYIYASPPSLTINPYLGEQPYTYIILKSGSTYYVKNGTTGYICYENIISYWCFEYAVKNDTHIYIKEARYNLIGALHIVNKHNVILEGDGSNSYLYTTQNHPVIQIINSTDIVIKNLSLEGDLDYAKTEQTGIQMYSNCNNILIEKCFIKHMGYDAIHTLYGVTNCKILNCFIDGMGDDGINPGGGGGNPNSLCSLIDGNYIINVVSHGIHLSTFSTYNIVSNNFIAYCSGGISVYNSSHNIIQGNIIKNCIKGIFIEYSYSPYTDILNNQLDIISTQAIQLTNSANHSKVIGNTITNCGNYAIEINPNYFLIVSQNIIRNATRGIYCIGQYNLITENSLYQLSDYGIVLSGGFPYGYSTVSFNIIVGVTSNDGVFLNSAYVTVQSNFIKNTVGGTSIDEIGTHNHIYDNQYDESISLTGTNSVIDRNTIF